MATTQELSKYAKKEHHYFEMFFKQTYDICFSVEEERLTPELAISMIDNLIAHIEDLTVETPIQDYESELQLLNDGIDTHLVVLKSQQVKRNKIACVFAETEATYLQREDDLGNVMLEQNIVMFGKQD